jgi:hypothetical protein
MNIETILTKNNEPYGIKTTDGTLLRLESLINKEYFHDMLTSGWQLYDLPYDFRKDGVRLLDLQKEEYDPPYDVEQKMWDDLGNPLSMDELRSQIVRPADTGMTLPDGEYLIFTRQELLNYLDAYDENNTVDFLPLNYFVHPDALFTWDEFFSFANGKYTAIIERRRDMSVLKFTKLVNWALTKGLASDFSSIDLVNFYFQWGVDGLNVPIYKRTQEDKTIALNANKSIVGDTRDILSRQGYKYNDSFFVDKDNNVHSPNNEFYSHKWRFDVPENVLINMRRGIDADEVRLVPVVRYLTVKVTTLQTQYGDIEFDNNTLLIAGYKAKSLIVRDVGSDSDTIHPMYWNPNTWEERKALSFLKIISAELVKSRTVMVDVSSYRALLEVGCGPCDAIYKIWLVRCQEVDASEESPLSEFMEDTAEADDKKDKLFLTKHDIYDYLSGAEIHPAKQKFIESVIEGETLIDNVAQGQGLDSRATPSRYYDDFHALYKIWGISPEEIYRAVKSLGEDDDNLTFKKDGFKFNIKVETFDNMYKGFLLDKRDYRIKQADTAGILMYVTRIARELGSEYAKRHVAVEYLAANCENANKESGPIVNSLKEMYRNNVDASTLSPQKKELAKTETSTWAAIAVFDLVMKGVVKFPKNLGCDDYVVSNEERARIKGTMRLGIDDTMSISNNIVTGPTSFDSFCVNACITPEYVIPAKGHSIPEVSLAALWHSKDNMSSEVRNILVKNGCLANVDDGQWTCLYFNCALYNPGINTTGLDVYMREGEEERVKFPADVEFVTVTHPLHKQCPVLVKDAEPAKLSEPRQGAPKFRIGQLNILTKEDVRAFDEVQSLDEIEFSGIRKFTGFTCDDFIQTNRDLKYPEQGKNMRYVNSEVLHAEGIGEIAYEEIESLNRDEYPVVRVTGRKYLFSDIYMKLWEVIL